MQDGEIAIYAEYADAPTMGTTECSVEGPNGETVQGALPAWSYDIQPQPIGAKVERLD